jgi:hypothetical protein
LFIDIDAENEAQRFEILVVEPAKHLIKQMLTILRWWRCRLTLRYRR